jgi:hypothetical protein
MLLHVMPVKAVKIPMTVMKMGKAEKFHWLVFWDILSKAV